MQLDLDSIPPGATVRDAESEQRLGRTPFHTTLSSERNDVWLLLRKTGYQDRVLHFVLRAGEHHQKHSFSPALRSQLDLPDLPRQRAGRKVGIDQGHVQRRVTEQLFEGEDVSALLY